MQHHHPGQAEYRQWSGELSLPLFLQPWWYDAACGADGWQASVVLAPEGQIHGAWPYAYKNSWGIRRIAVPPLTPWSGMWLKYPETLYTHQKHSFERQVIGQLLDQAPKCQWFYQAFYPDFPNGLPFHWRGFSHKMSYSYVLEDLSDKSRLWHQMKETVHRKIHKAEKLCTVDTAMSGEDFLQFHQQTWQQRSGEAWNDPGTFMALDKAIKSQHAGKIYRAIDAEGRTHAAIYVIHDAFMANVWHTASDPLLRKSGALMLLYWTAIQDHLQSGRWFDFEGGMLEGTETAYSAFGATRSPIHVFSRSGNRLWAMLSLWTRRQYH